MGFHNNRFWHFFPLGGTKLYSDKDKVDVIKKIEEISQRIETLKTEAVAATRVEKLSVIEKELNKWAKNFISNKERKKIALEKSSLDNREKLVDLSDKWRSLYTFAFDYIKKLLDAYNSSVENKIIYSIPEMPFYLFSSEAGKFIAKIQFNPVCVWKIRIISSPLDPQDLPTIAIYIDNNFKANTPHSLQLVICPMSNINKITIIVINNKIQTNYLKKYYSLDKYEESLKEILRILIENQLLNL